MNRSIKVGVIGSGATALFFLKHVSDQLEVFRDILLEITIFEKEDKMAMGMPYNPRTTDIHNLSNISSDEIPALPETFGNWLRRQDKQTLQALNINDRDIDDSKVYSRLALGYYLHAQYGKLTFKINSGGVAVREMNNTMVTDIVYDTDRSMVKVVDDRGEVYDFSKVIIATGHAWKEGDNPPAGYYASPWPIQKIIPPKDTYHNFTIGTLGASLSAFDVVSSLAHRHGTFAETNGELKFTRAKRAKDFKIQMHSAEGWLPHLQYLQENPMREIYRHTDRQTVLSLVDDEGYLSLETFFQEVCKPALKSAFQKDKKEYLIDSLDNPGFGIVDFVEKLSGEHEYVDSFDGMKQELVMAEAFQANNRPVHWKETLDDLMYCLNFHAELLPAEDHLLLQKKIMPFLLNVIAALPLPSARILLALHQAGCIEMIPGKVQMSDDHAKRSNTKIILEKEDGDKEELEYRLFINCAGQDLVELEEFPFPGLLKAKHVRKARANFRTAKSPHKDFEKKVRDKVFEERGKLSYEIGGIDIDPTYRILAEDGKPIDAICDIAFSHALGIRPYSYGLQACNATSKIMVTAWAEDLQKDRPGTGGSREMTKLYESTDDL
ncbi:FAD/NAD(P)-binding protein [Zeaxanthinibacter sp. PT1]|uniref:FAD/NAD(P)-binding protein n=1 Tax=Zeaxanthinibacter TaxID=561554 RepID=UPI00234AA218|nr:FAD/NAD(P)-binding protein [Zeaxanthinibacter sp. PT1]MDC6352225.1 FAD/NAD(P)-binding protein [Zeaxanthinibacter sp. PT1]